MFDEYSLKQIELANTLCASDLYNEALPYFDKVIELNPQHLEANYKKGYSLFKLGRYEEALSCFNNIIGFNPQGIEQYYYATAYYRKAETLEKLGRYEEALYCLMERDPKDYRNNISYLEKNFITKLILKSQAVNSEYLCAITMSLEKNNSLRELDLSDNNIGTEGAYIIAMALKKNNSLESLDLSENYIEDESAIMIANSLKQNSSLISLNLGSNAIGINGITNIFMSLEKNNSLRELDLSDNNIGAEGAYIIAMALKKNNSLVYLNLSANNFNTNSTNIILNEWKHNYTMKEVRGLEEQFIDINCLINEFSIQENEAHKYQIARIVKLIQYNEAPTTLKMYTINYESGAKYLFKNIANIADVIYEKDSIMNKILKENTTLIEQNIFKMISDFAGDTAITSFRIVIDSTLINKDKKHNSEDLIDSTNICNDINSRKRYKDIDIEMLDKEGFPLLKKQHVNNYEVLSDLMGLSANPDPEDIIN